MTHGANVRLAIISEGLEIWRDDPSKFTVRGIAGRVGMTHSAILYHFKTVDALRQAVADRAVKTGDSRAIMHLIALGHPAVAAMSDAQRAAHMRAAR